MRQKSQTKRGSMAGNTGEGLFIHTSLNIQQQCNKTKVKAVTHTHGSKGNTGHEQEITKGN